MKLVNRMIKIIVFASGSGTNAENIIKYFKARDVGNVVAVFTNNPKANVINKAEILNVPSVIFSKEDFIESGILQKLNSFRPDLIVLAGFLLKLPENFVSAYPNKIINIHPAILPKYGGKGMYGMKVHNAVVENKEKESGITIHYVNEHYDEGNIIFQKKVTILVTDTPEVVADKIHELEQRYFPEVIEKLITNTL
jgi:phosphoribosylglycinamide formyltransferase-1